MAYGKYNIADVARHCESLLSTGFHKAREERFEKKITSLVKSKEEDKKKWWGFLVKIPTRAEAREYLKHDSDLIPTYDMCKYAYREDEGRIEEIAAVCRTCTDEFIFLSSEDAIVLSRWGMKTKQQHERI